VRELNSGFPLSQARACLNGEIVTDLSIKALDGDELSVRFVPGGGGTTEDAGAGMKIGGWALAALGIAACFIPGLGAPIGIAIIGTGLSMALGGAVLLNVDIPSLSDRERPENDPSIRGGKNQSRPGGRIPVLFGRRRVYPDLAANPHTQIIGGRQYYVQLFCGGYRDCSIDLSSIKLGETLLADLSETKDIGKILSGADSAVRLEILQNGEASEVYPRCVHEDAISAPLQKAIDAPGGGKMPGALVRSTPDRTDAINVDIFFYNGLGKYSDSGELGPASVEVRVSYKPFDAPDSAYALLGHFNSGSSVISGAELKTKRFQAEKSGLAPGRYTVKIERVTPDSTDSKVVDQVHAGSVRSFKSAPPVSEARRKGLTVIALRALATGQMNGMLDSFNYVATARLPVYSGGGSGPLYWLEAAETRNPASALLCALQGRAAQQPVDPADIDWPSLEAFYAWCGQKDADGDPKYACDAYLSESVTIAELMRMIGGTARAEILRIDSKISVVQDIERPAPVQLFTPKNTISYSVAMFSADIPDAIALGFADGDSGYAQNELKVYNTPDGNPPSRPPETIQKADLWGVTNSKQARRIGMYNYACLKNRPFVHTIEADIEYLVCGKGDWVQYAGDIALAGTAQGRIKGAIWAGGLCVGIDTDEPIAMAEGKRWAVRVRRSDGTIILKDAVPAGKRLEKSIAYYPGGGEDLYEPPVGALYAVGEDNAYYEPLNAVYFAEPLAEADAPKAGDVYAFGARGYEALDLVITDVQPGQNLTAVLACVEYSPEIFGVDRPGFVLPEFASRITPVSGAVDSGVVNPDRMRSFYAWHDGEEEPERPSGDGQNGGWHRVQTYRSVWQSAKTAESADSGEWGLPVRIRAQRGAEDITPVWLSLSPQRVAVETDGGGSVLSGLPFAVQARLHKWNSVLPGAEFSLVGAPPGVSADPLTGVITAAAGAALGGVDSITVRASYQGAAYTAALSIEKSAASSVPRYLGTVAELAAGSAAGAVAKGPAAGQATARLGDYVLAVAAVAGRLAGSVFQWAGASWEYRPPENYSELYIRCFRDGLDVPELSQDMGWFGAVFARLLAAQQAFIEELSAQVIKLQAGGAIYGGNKYLASGNADPQAPAGAKGFWLGANGELKAEGGEFSGKVIADSGSFSGKLEWADGRFAGELDCDSLQVKYDAASSQRFPEGDSFFPVGSSVFQIMNNVKAYLSTSQNEFDVYIDDGYVDYAGGAYFSSHRIAKLRFNFYGDTRLTIYRDDGTASSSCLNTTKFPFWFRLGTTLKKIRLVDLPYSPGNGASGTVYKKYDPVSGEYYIMVK
jgi:hypothetical protein